MHHALLWIGRLAGVGGLLLLAVAAAVRLQGRYTIGTYQAGTLLLAGTALAVVGCLAYLAYLAEARPSLH